MGSRGQFTRSSVAHNHLGTTSTFNEMATEGEAQCIGHYTFEGPFSTTRPTKVQPAAPKSNVSSIQAPCSVGQFARGVAKGEGEFFTVDTCASRAFDRNHRVAGFATRGGAVEEGAERVVGKAEFPVHGRCWGFSRSRRQAPLSRAHAMRHQALWFRNRHSRYGLRGVRVGEASQVLQGLDILPSPS